MRAPLQSPVFLLNSPGGDAAMTVSASDVPDEGSFFASEAGDARMGE